ncbi:MAG TPA: hypothetical protein VH257_13605 [Chloroflexota bacterium]|nr:hypothetical protein [Chloroflexota bacterium]
MPELVSPLVSGAIWLAVIGLSFALLWWRATRTPELFAVRPGARRGAALLRPVSRSYRVRVEAERRAEQMLRDILPEPDFQHLTRRGYLEVRSPSFPNRLYLIPERQGPVTVYEHGRPIMRLCIQCVERVPDHDTVAMHKLMIEGNEQEYLRIANRV